MYDFISDSLLYSDSQTCPNIGSVGLDFRYFKTAIVLKLVKNSIHFMGFSACRDEKQSFLNIYGYVSP